MLRDAVAMVITAVVDLFILAALIRFWMQAFRAPARSPLGMFAIALSDWAVKPLRRVIPGAFKLDWASFVLAWALAYVMLVTLRFVLGKPLDNGEILSALVVQSLILVLRYSVYVFMVALIIQVVLSFMSPRHPVMPFFDAFTRPFLRPVQRVLPSIGGIDISPLFVFLFFQLLLMIPIAWLEAQAAALVTRAAL